MKRFEELTDAEVRALSDDQVEYHIDLACAEAGVPLLPPPPGPAPEKPDAEPDVDVFSVGEMHFRTASDAEAARAAIATFPRYDLVYNYTSPRYEKRVMPADDVLQVQCARHYSPERWEQVRGALEAYDRAKKEQEQEMKEYREATRKRDAIAEDIRGRIAAAWAAERRRELLRGHFERYLQLAGGDAVVAARFLLNAYPDARDVLGDALPDPDQLVLVPAEAEKSA